MGFPVYGDPQAVVLLVRRAFSQERGGWSRTERGWGAKAALTLGWNRNRNMEVSPDAVKVSSQVLHFLSSKGSMQGQDGSGIEWKGGGGRL